MGDLVQRSNLACNAPWVFSQQLWGCISSIPQHTLHHTVLPQACASWWCLFVPSPTCHGWGILHRLWVYCTWVLGSARLSPGHQLLSSDGELILPMCWSGFQLSHTPVKSRSRTCVSCARCERQRKSIQNTILWLKEKRKTQQFELLITDNIIVIR